MIFDEQMTCKVSAIILSECIISADTLYVILHLFSRCFGLTGPEDEAVAILVGHFTGVIKCILVDHSDQGGVKIAEQSDVEVQEK